MKTKKKRNTPDDDEIYDTYYRATASYFPVRWTAPEGVRHNRFSSASDVWSFAIVIVEIWQDGRKPYSDKNNRAVRAGLETDATFMHPNIGCDDALYNLMKDCWNQDPDKRPKFGQILKRLEEAKGSLTRSSMVLGPISADTLLDLGGCAAPPLPPLPDMIAVDDGHDYRQTAANNADGYERPVSIIVPAPLTTGNPPTRFCSKKVSAGVKCRKPTRTKYCEDHTCPEFGCKQSKLTAAHACKKHLKPEIAFAMNSTFTPSSRFEFSSREADEMLLCSQL